MKPILHSRIIIFCMLLSVFSVSAQDKLTYANPSDVGLDSTYIYHNVDSIMTLGIQNRAFPGAQVLVAKDSKIIFHKAYGFQTYDSVQQVGLNDIYDLASVTKITAALPAIMKLVDEGKLGLDKPFSDYWKPWKHVKNKKDLTLREILAHQAGLQPYIVFLSKVFKKNGEIKKRFVKRKAKRGYTNQAYNGLFIKNRFNRKMYRIANRSKVSAIKKYKYSGLTFLMYPELVKQITGKPFDTYLQETFYKPLGASTMGFLPKTKNFTNSIIPTEVDSLFRKELTRGWVHDENAALLGGISGNAGLFATATDLAKIMQMYMNYGVYDGKRYFSEATVKEFTKIQYPENDNRRGLGFDKPSIGNDTLALKDAYPAPEVSAESFGHSGFTGTFIWADPKEKLVYIFLSNRVNPTRKSRGIYTYNIRSAIQEVFYKAKKE
ncbi:serine hydrolase [Aureibaculum algae]|uniref:Serine hydrolase n=2 Tax=Aureibaculum algae TaxID=2584122 RepID=A0A5B7TPG1_9FLAO|nr:serine hydrolase [Aureibaculum algae]